MAARNTQEGQAKPGQFSETLLQSKNHTINMIYCIMVGGGRMGGLWGVRHSLMVEHLPNIYQALTSISW